jgi:flavin-dependent dehydrogenase
VVLGASLAGLLAARVLAETFETVTLVDRDVLPEDVAPRRGVPQGWQTHGLLAGGRAVFEDFFPGLTDELVDCGAAIGDVVAGARWINDGHRFARSPSTLRALTFSRPLLEDRVRRRVRALPRVTESPPTTVLDLCLADRRVTAVQLRDRATGQEQVIETDLVVDATGRGSRLPTWLDAHGYARPPESVVEGNLVYTTWRFPREKDDLDGDIAVLISATVTQPRFGAAFAVEGGRWEVTAGSYGGDTASATDWTAFCEYTLSLVAPDIAQLLADRKPVGTGRVHRFPAGRRRHYEKLAAFPEGLLVIGDALASLNPVYGQGMTVAALEAQTLRAVLAEGTDGLAGRFFPQAARVIDVPWGLASSADLRLPQVPGARPLQLRLVNAYIARVLASAATDATVAEAFLRVAHAIDRPETLMRPAVASRVLRARLQARRRPAGVPRPRTSPEDAATESLPDRTDG